MLSAMEELTVSAAMNRDGLVQMIENVDENHKAAHKRLRDDIQRLELELDKGLNSLREAQQANKLEIEAIRNTPIDATKLVLNSKVVVALVVMVLGAAAAVWSIRSGQDQLAAEVKSYFKVQDIHNAGMKSTVEALGRRIELLQYEQREREANRTEKLDK